MTSKISCFKAILSASNYFVTTPFLYGMTKLEHKKTYSGNNYALILPVWLGFWNTFGLICSNIFGLSTRTRFLLQGILTYLLSVMIVRITKAYKFTEKEWKIYYVSLFFAHMFTWNFTVYHIESLLN